MSNKKMQELASYQMRALTPFGLEVEHFCVDARIRKRHLALLSGVNPETLHDVVFGNREGSRGTVEKVRAFMSEYNQNFKREV